jgi:hypothetical protein
MQPDENRRSKEDAGRLLRECLGDGRFIPTRHFRRELEKEGLSIVDALIIIRRGYVFDEPELDISTGQWKYRVTGTAPEGEFVVIVFCFNSDDEAVLITVFSERGSR